MRCKTLLIPGAVWLCLQTSVALSEDAVKDPKPAATHEPLGGTKPLTMAGDIAPQRVTGVTRFLHRKMAESQYARRLAASGCRVLVPTLIDRKMKKRHAPDSTSGSNLTSREFLYRSAFELGRHLIGYEVQKVLAGVDWFVKDAGKESSKIGVMGYGEGGMLALYAGALDPRIKVICVSGYFGDRRK